MERQAKFALKSALLASLLAVLVSASPARAMYAEIDLEEIPIDRLAANLQRRVQQNPRDAQAQHQLARIHAMAYSSKRESLIVVPGTGELWCQAWHVPFLAQCHKKPVLQADTIPQLVPIDGKPVPQDAKPVPQDNENENDKGSGWKGWGGGGGTQQVQATNDPKQLAAAKEHLGKAIEHYKKALELDADNLTVRLGYAWVLDQSGQKDQAVAGYRQVIEKGWEQEKKLLVTRTVKTAAGVGIEIPCGTVGPDWQSITAEAAGYLLSHLDAKKDAAEITSLKERIAKLAGVNRAVTPLVIPLVANYKIETLVNRAAQVRFDADGSGLKRPWSWITPQAGWLVLDPNRTGRVKSALQMFGSVSYWCFWRDGYAALSALDDNGDGQLTGEELRDLAVWRDTNTDGVSDPGEVRPLADWRIVALSCRGEAAPPQLRSVYCARSTDGVRFRDGSVRPTYDVMLHRAEGRSIAY